MKILPPGTKAPKGAGRVVTVVLDEGEDLIALKADNHYRLGYPLEDDVVCGRHLIEAQAVEWCVVAQKWIE